MSAYSHKRTLVGKRKRRIRRTAASPKISERRRTTRPPVAAASPLSPARRGPRGTAAARRVPVSAYGPLSLKKPGPKTQSAGHNARLFFYGFFREMQQDFVVSEKKNTAFGISVHLTRISTEVDFSSCDVRLGSQADVKQPPSRRPLSGVKRTSPLATPVNQSMP